MGETEVTMVAAAWAPLVLALLAALVVLAATVDGLLSSRASGAVGGASRPFGEVARLLRQRRVTTVAADGLLWRAGGAGLLVAAALMLAVVPLGDRVLLDLDVGVVWFNAMDVSVWALVWLTGWGANSAYSLVGAYRFLALALAYELPLMFALVAPAIAAGSLDVGEVAAAQSGVWFVVWMPVAFAVYCLGAVAISASGPFAAPFGADVGGGVRGELSGVDRLVLEVGRYALLAAGAAFAVPMFLGGGSGPYLPGWAWVLLKTFVLLAFLVRSRRRVSGLRPDRLMQVGWLVLLPVTLLQDLVVAVVAAGTR